MNAVFREAANRPQAPPTLRLLLLLLVPVVILAACSDDDDSSRPTVPQPTDGTLVVTTRPDSLSGPWEVTGPDGFQTSGTGSAMLDDLDPGEYAIVWERLPLWFAPAPLQMDVTAGDTTEFLGEYAPITTVVPERVMLIFLDAHAAGATAAYADLLSEDFQFVRAGGDPIYDRATDVAIMDRIFSGEAGSNGLVVAAVEVIEFEPQGPWEATPADDPHFGQFPGSLQRTFEIQLDFVIEGQFLVLRVQGPAIFHVREERSARGAEYELLGVLDATFGGKGVENNSWTDVKELFR